MAIALKVAVGLIGLLLGLFGVQWMFSPETIAATQGIGLDGIAALNNARGDLGGMFISATVLCALGLVTRDGRWLQALAVVLGCIALGRAVGMIADGFATTSLTPMIVELVMLGVLLLAARLPGQAEKPAG